MNFSFLKVVSSVGVNAGQGIRHTPPYPRHFTLHGAGMYGLQRLYNLHRLSPTSAFMWAAPLKIGNVTISSASGDDGVPLVLTANIYFRWMTLDGPLRCSSIVG